MAVVSSIFVSSVIIFVLLIPYVKEVLIKLCDNTYIKSIFIPLKVLLINFILVVMLVFFSNMILKIKIKKNK